MAKPVAKLTGNAAKAKELLGFRRYAEAEALLRQAIRREPNNGPIHALLAEALGFLGRAEASEAHLREAIRLEPSDHHLLESLGDLLISTGRRAEGVEAFERAIELGERSAAVFTAIAEALQTHRLPMLSVDVAERGLKEHPWHPPLVSALAVVLSHCGRSDEAVTLLRQAATHHPDHALTLGGLAQTLNYPPGIDPLETAAAHRRYGELVQREHPPFAHPRPGPDRATKRLRVGFLSPDLHTHACSFFFEPLISSLDRAGSVEGGVDGGIDVCCYSLSDREDDRTAALKKLAQVWRQCAHCTPGVVAERIRSDNVDILIDLAGLTAGAMPAVMALRPAPVQMTYLGYPNTTGLTTVDYRIVDSLTDPRGGGEAEKYAVERLIRLDPCFLCYGGLKDVPPLPPSPRGNTTHFGSFNALQKVNAPLIDLWTRVVTAVPDSRLVMKYLALSDGPTRELVRSRFEAAGLASDRLTLLEPTRSYRDHLAAYAHVDIALDTYPYHGTTTTCEALWMGVPVVTLAESPDVHAARVGISLLTAVGLTDLIAPTRDEFVRIASSLAADTPRIRKLRSRLRDQMLASPLCDRAAFGLRFAAALRSAWREWCQARP